MRYLITICLFMAFTTSTIAQKNHLEGYWKGYITQGTLDGVTGLTFELYLQVKDGYRVSGRSYSYYETGEVIEMKVEGVVHGDRSVNLSDTHFLPIKNADANPTHSKKYQFAHHRSAFITSNRLEGYWQEFIDDPFEPKRRRGKVVLRKVNNMLEKP